MHATIAKAASALVRLIRKPRRAHLTTTAVGCPASVIEGVLARVSKPVGAAPLEEVVLATLKIASSEPPLSGTITKAPSDVMPPETGPAPVETTAGLSGLSEPLAGPYLNCDTSFDWVSTTYTKSSTGLTIIELGPIPAAETGETLTACSRPVGLEQVGVTSMHAAKMEMLFERPEFATNRLSPSDAVQLELSTVPPAQRENASPAGFAPVG